MSELQACNLLDMSVWFEVHEMLNRRVFLKDTLVTLGVVSPNELMYVHNQCMIVAKSPKIAAKSKSRASSNPLTNPRPLCLPY